MRSRQPVAVTAGRALGHGLATRRRQVVAGLVLGLLLSPIGIAAVGGFETADAIQPEQVAAGETMNLGQVEVTVQSYFVSDRVYTGGLPDGASAWFGLVVDVVNPRDEEVVLHRDLFRVPVASPLQPEPTTTRIVGDGGFLVVLEPDLPQRVAVLWALADPGQFGGEATVEAYPVLAGDSFFSPGDIRWDTQPLQSIITVPAGEVPPALLEDQT
ncbi:hypothetical protein [Ruania alba]|uniref:DUF4352 domain-containing protein n=1 Tax=Ruania alba TaxID=648782 RepID=A0A1H5MLW7_9MICO|nr:hypothetical protein [Ruania alba]SEE89611.1 hypothetical protein SAMN04488554_3448 [Ruania alba]